MIVVAGALGREFGRRSDVLRQQHLMHQQREEKDRKARTDRADNEFSEFADAALLVVSSDEITSFRSELDSYDAATIAALNENRIALERVQERMEVLLDQAHVLPDGRRVFKTENGTQVFDEFGHEVDPAVIDPDQIDNSRPHWESYEPHFVAKIRLLNEQTKLFDYQEKLDDARERLDTGKITRAEYEELQADIRDSAPERVREHLPDSLRSKEAAPDQPAASPAKAEELDITADMLQSGSVPSPMG